MRTRVERGLRIPRKTRSNCGKRKHVIGRGRSEKRYRQGPSQLTKLPVDAPRQLADRKLLGTEVSSWEEG